MAKIPLKYILVHQIMSWTGQILFSKLLYVGFMNWNGPKTIIRMNTANYFSIIDADILWLMAMLDNIFVTIIPIAG